MVKILLAGGTGLIGGAVLQRLIDHPDVTSIVALSRRELSVKNSKVTTVIVKDFLKYDDAVLAQLEGAEGAVWALGKPTSGKDVHEGYTLAAIEQFSSAVVAKQDPSATFNFVYTSGSAVESDLNKTLWFLGGVRKMRGALQNKVIAYTQPAARGGGQWRSYVVRPALVTTGVPFWAALPGVAAHNTPKEELAATMVKLVLDGSASAQIFDNAEIRQVGREELKIVKA